MSCVTAVDGEWLAELGPMFFSVKESFATSFQRLQKERKNMKRMEEEMNRAEEEETKEKANPASTKREVQSLRSANNRKSHGNGSVVATPGRLANATHKFMPKKRG